MLPWVLTADIAIIGISYINCVMNVQSLDRDVARNAESTLFFGEKINQQLIALTAVTRHEPDFDYFFKSPQ